MATKAHPRIARTDSTPTYETIDVSPLNPVLGAEIAGVNLSQPLSNTQLAEVRQAFIEHSVLIFRDQELTREDHKRFGRYFGKLHTHPYHTKDPEPGAPPRDPDILEVRGDQNSRYVAGEGWHSDVTCDVEPPFGSMLYITEIPEIGYGGDTCFLSSYEAYEALSPGMKEFLEGYDAVHDGAKPYTGGYGMSDRLPPE